MTLIMNQHLKYECSQSHWIWKRLPLFVCSPVLVVKVILDHLKLSSKIYNLAEQNKKYTDFKMLKIEMNYTYFEPLYLDEIH